MDDDGLILRSSLKLSTIPKRPPKFRSADGPTLQLTHSMFLGDAKSTGITPFSPKSPARNPGNQPSLPVRAALPPSGPNRQQTEDGDDGDVDAQSPGEGNMPSPVVARKVPKAELAGKQITSEEVGTTDGAGDKGVLAWTIPPIRWSGAVGYSMRRNSTSDGSHSMDQLLNTNVRGSSYIYAPWLASVSGDFGVFTNVSKSRSEESQTGDSSQNASVIGNANLDMFPASRFPFGASFSRTDSRMSSSAVSSNYTNTRFGLRQSYSSEDNRYALSSGFDHSTVVIQGGQQDTVNAFHGNLSAPMGKINNSLGTTFSASQRGATGQGATLFSLNSSHSYAVQENLSLQAYSNFTNNVFRLGTDTPGGNTRGQYLQMGTSASWRPEFEDEEDYPLTVNGGVSYSAGRNNNGFNSFQSQRLGANTSAFYRFSPNLSVNGSGSMFYYTTESAKPVSATMLGSGISYTGDVLEIGKFSYYWNSGANLAWQSSAGNAPAAMYAGVQAGHSLSRNIALSDGKSLSINLSQSGALSQSQNSGNTSTLTHSLGSSYQMGFGERFSGAITSTFSDVITSGISSQHYQSLNLGFNGTGQLSSRSFASVNMMMIWTGQTIKASSDGFNQQNMSAQRMTLIGSASYNNIRFVGVQGLRYTFLLSANTLSRDNRLLGDANAQVQGIRYNVDNRLDYRIGRLDTRLSATVTDDGGGKKNALLFFQVTRQIGGF